ncbi:MAG: hypothetical protein AVDCRST_MAG26-1067, partial [uncultured Chloroflexia bacterium]
WATKTRKMLRNSSKRTTRRRKSRKKSRLSQLSKN